MRAASFRKLRPSVSSQDIGLSFAPNQVINQVSGLDQPTGLQYITNGTAISANRGYSAAVLVAEAGANRVTQLGVVAQFPGNRFEKINSTGTGLGPTSFAGDPLGVRFFPPSPRFTTYYVGNAGGGTVRRADYVGGVIGIDIPVPGVFKIASWWTR